jgi:hypothetical protein
MRPSLLPAIGDLFDRAREAYAGEVRRNATGIGAEIRKRREAAARDLVRVLGGGVAAVDLVDLDGWTLDRSWTWGPATFALGPLSIVHEQLPGANRGELYAIAYRGRSIGPSPLEQLSDIGRVLDDVGDRIDATFDAGLEPDERPAVAVTATDPETGAELGAWSTTESGEHRG